MFAFHVGTLLSEGSRVCPSITESFIQFNPFIPKIILHRLENPRRIPLEIIEVQCGIYLKEDDIVRLNDCYGRDN